MLKLESKIGTILYTDEKIYRYLLNFDNIKNLIPGDKIKNWESQEDSCRFTVTGLGDAGVRILEKEPYKLIKLTGIDEGKYNFFFWIQLKQVAENDTKIRLSMHVELNQVMQMMAKNPLKTFLDTLVDQLSKIDYDHQ